MATRVQLTGSLAGQLTGSIAGLRGGQFVGYGGPRTLAQLVKLFLDWAATEEDWLAVPAMMTAQELDFQWYQDLGNDVGPDECRNDCCNNLRIKRSVFCRKHHFEQIKGYLPEE